MSDDIEDIVAMARAAYRDDQAASDPRGGQAMSLHTIAAWVAVTSYVALWVITLWMAQK